MILDNIQAHKALKLFSKRVIIFFLILFFSFKYLSNIRISFLNLINTFNIKILKNIKNKYLFNIFLKKLFKNTWQTHSQIKKIKKIILNHKKSRLLIHGILGWTNFSREEIYFFSISKLINS